MNYHDRGTHQGSLAQGRRETTLGVAVGGGGVREGFTEKGVLTRALMGKSGT